MRCAIMVETGRLVKIDRAEVAAQDLPDPLAEADQEWTIEAEACPDAAPHRPASPDRPRITRGRIAGAIEQAEHEQRYDRHHRDGRDDAAGDVGQHGAMVAGTRAVLPTPRHGGQATARAAKALAGTSGRHLLPSPLDIRLAVSLCQRVYFAIQSKVGNAGISTRRCRRHLCNSQPLWPARPSAAMVRRRLPPPAAWR